MMKELTQLEKLLVQMVIQLIDLNAGRSAGTEYVREKQRQALQRCGLTRHQISYHLGDGDAQ